MILSFISLRIVVTDAESSTGSLLWGVMSNGSLVTFPRPSETHFQIIGAVVSAIRTELFGDILKVSNVGFPFDCMIFC